VNTRPASIHWLRENHAERSPHRLLFFDTETAPRTESDTDHHVLRLWESTLVRRHGRWPALPGREPAGGTTAASLADEIERVAKSDVATWVLSHNLNFDLAVTALPVLLVERGWRMTEGALTSDDPWCRFSRGSRRLAIADTWSWLPRSVTDLGDLIGLPKDATTDLAAGDEDWRRRCRRDVEIIASAFLSVLDWWDQGRYGNWTITGPSTGWSSYRHHRPTPRVLVDPDPAARAQEQRAITGGRRDVMRVGPLPRGLYADVDMHTAHLTAMAGCLLPSRRLRHFDQLPTDAHELHSTVLDVLAECEVEVVRPRYPWDSGHGVFYPVGRFRTVLAGPEIRDAAARGELRSIGAGYRYQLSRHMAPWALWLASLIAEETPDVPPAVRLMAKHWSRCVPGKWAGHASDVVFRTPDPRPGWHVERGHVMPGHRPADFLLIGGERWTITRDEWQDDAFPAILAWIQAYTRVAVNRLLDKAGAAALLVNTDGVVLDVEAATGARLVRRDKPGATEETLLLTLDFLTQVWDHDYAPFSVRIKGATDRVTIYSPQHVILGAERRLAGIPRRAHQLADGRYSFTAWPRLRVQIARPDPEGYRTQQRTVSVGNIPPNGWLLESGEVLPVCVSAGAVVPLTNDLRPDARRALAALAPADRQHALVRPLMPPEAAQDRPGRADQLDLASLTALAP
jgi:hypothetical protein